MWMELLNFMYRKWAFVVGELLLGLEGSSTLLYFSLTALGRGLNDRVQILVVFVYDSKHNGADS